MFEVSSAARSGRTRRYDRTFPWFAALASCLVANGARADAAGAETLFKDAKQLFAAGKVDAACEKFAESQRLDPSPGTLLNLARCHEKQGKTATAWAEYLAAKRAAGTAHRTDIEEAAGGYADALGKQLSYLTIDAAVKSPDLQVSRDGVKLEAASLGAKLPVDPGAHHVTATAPGYETWSADVPVADRQSAELHIPELTKKAVMANPVPPSRAATSGSNTAPADIEPHRHAPVLAYVLGGIGIASIGTGLAFGALAKGKYDSAIDACPDRVGCSQGALSDRGDANTFANVANVAVPVGIAALGAGVVLFIVKPGQSNTASQVRTNVSWTPGGARLVAEGRF